MIAETKNIEKSTDNITFNSFKQTLSNLFFKSLISYSKELSDFTNAMKSNLSESEKQQIEYKFRESEVERRSQFSLFMTKFFSDTIIEQENNQNLLEQQKRELNSKDEVILKWASNLVKKVEASLGKN